MAARRKFLFDIHCINTFCKNFKDIEADTLTVQLLEVKDRELEKKWLSAVESYTALVFENSKEGAELVFDDANTLKYDEAASQYEECKSKLLYHIQQKNSEISMSTSQQSPQGTAHTLKLPPCDIHSFEGGYSKWPPFRDIFMAVFGRHPHLSSAQKLYHLRGKTKGEAHEIVAKFELVDGNFNLAWEALKNRYENKRILVHQQLSKLFGISQIQVESAKTLRQLLSSVDDSLSILKSYDVEVDNWDPVLIHLVSSKLHEETLKYWEDSLHSHKELPSWQQMNTFLANRIEKLETLMDMRKTKTREQNHKTQSFHTGQSKDNSKLKCKMCRQEHSLRQCKEFLAMSPKDRINYVMSNNICLNCLSYSHFKPKCPSTYHCSKCNRKHHTLLHIESDPHHQPSSRDKSQVRSENNFQHSKKHSENVQTMMVQNESPTILPTALINIEYCGELFTIRALLDGGSERSFITSRVQQKLRLPVSYHKSQISGLAGTVVSHTKGKCDLTLCSRYSQFRIKTTVLIVTNLAQFLPSRYCKPELITELDNLDLADPFFYKPCAIDMIIGSDYLPQIHDKGIIMNIGGGMEARESKFGWYLSGIFQNSSINSFSTMIINDDVPLEEELKRFWEIEELEQPYTNVIENDYCESYYQETTYRQEDGRYVVRLPFRKEYPNDMKLGVSKNMAMAQYLRMEKTLNKTPLLKQSYDRVLTEYVELGHMKKVLTPEENITPHFFLPHHAVFRPESKTTKVRVVFNASKKSTSGLSLNDILYTGPVLQPDLMNIILNWRFYEFVFNGDIQKMYRQINLHKNDQAYQRILFRSSIDKSIETFQLQTVTFGVNAAPFLAIRTLIQLANDSNQLYPKATSILKSETYVDDVLSGGHSLNEAIHKQAQLQDALKSAGFPLKKITANHPNLLCSLAPEDLLDEEFLKIEDHSSVKALGIRWNAMKDIFYYDVLPIDPNLHATKRKILSVIAKLYDPLGWISPVIVCAKMIMQALWQEKTHWDECLEGNIFTQWSNFANNLTHISTLKIPRWTQFSPTSVSEIHGFCDASEKAYCATIYLRTVNRNGTKHCHLLVAKTKIAPIKVTTIPKLELCAAVLLTKLVKSIVKDFEFKYQLFLWTDSSVVLGWLQKSPNTLKTFVGNRVGQILAATTISNWRHVKSSDNPADLGSRGCTPQHLVDHSLWWHGPAWLMETKEKWPETREFEPTDLESKPIATYFLNTRSEEIISRFSSYERCLRVVSHIFRFYNLCRKIRPTQLEITTREIEFVKNRLLIIAQKENYYNEYESLENNKPISKKSSILNLNPFLDNAGILRVGGRLTNSALNFQEKHPAVIPHKSALAELIVRFAHKTLLHAEQNVMLRAIRQGFFIPQLKNIIRKCIRQCKTCTIYKHKYQQQIMASLPKERSTFSLPFTFTGVDFAGPFNTKASAIRNAKLLKSYVAVFVCFSTKAVHLEVCTELSTESFLAAFTRFSGRRGLPKTMFSDNGRNFVGASNKLLKEHNEFLKGAEKCIQEKYAAHGFTWSFIPPHAPHMGGLWEAAVKSMKTHLKKTCASHNFTFEEFTTFLVRIEAILNSRPLCTMSNDPNELLPLTPGHFLRGAPIIALPDTTSLNSITNVTLHNRWQRLRQLQTTFSQRWKNEYVRDLQKRCKWRSTKENLQVNDMVIIKDDTLPSTEWRLGRVNKLFHGNDKNVRVAELRTQSGIIVRPIVKLCKLPTSTIEN